MITVLPSLFFVLLITVPASQAGRKRRISDRIKLPWKLRFFDILFLFVLLTTWALINREELLLHAFPRLIYNP